MTSLRITASGAPETTTFPSILAAASVSSHGFSAVCAKPPGASIMKMTASFATVLYFSSIATLPPGILYSDNAAYRKR